MLVEGVALDRWEQDQLRHRAAAQRARLDRGRGRIEAEQVVIHAFEHGAATATATVTAPRGVFDLKRERLVLFGGIVAEDAAGRVVETESATYAAGAQQITAAGEVRVRGENFTMSLSGVTIDLEKEQLATDQPVEARVEGK